ncbi:MAG: protein-glutamate O-methyltransferase [Neomegalonema sp.]|nr:protein-glutamate O-methyltransferase [Neomegalonema sp.]
MSNSSLARAPAVAEPGGSEFAYDRVELTDDDFRQAAALVGQLTGIVIKEHKREMIHSRLSRRLRALGLQSYKAYLEFVQSDAGKNEIGEFINVVTTNLTSFFREDHHFQDLKNKVLAQIAAEGRSRVRIWSSACSSGEEPYSIAMTVRESDAAQAKDLKILATDLDTNILARASAGVYAQDRVTAIPEKMLRASTKQVGDKFEFTSEVKRMITFRQLNLLTRWPFSGPFDVIFCRNVLIYFDADTKREVVNRMAQMLRPNGTLYLGHSESLLGEHALLSSEGKTIYRRRA